MPQPYTFVSASRNVRTDKSGQRHFHLLPGEYDSSESRTAFATLVLELEAARIVSKSL